MICLTYNLFKQGFPRFSCLRSILHIISLIYKYKLRFWFWTEERNIHIDIKVAQARSKIATYSRLLRSKYVAKIQSLDG